MQTTIVEINPLRKFKPGEREYVAKEIRECQWGIRNLRKSIARGEVDIPLARAVIVEFRKMIAARREVLGLRQWK